jgi:hypothetical protein
MCAPAKPIELVVMLLKIFELPCEYLVLLFWLAASLLPILVTAFCVRSCLDDEACEKTRKIREFVEP